MGFDQKKIISEQEFNFLIEASGSIGFVRQEFEQLYMLTETKNINIKNLLQVLGIIEQVPKPQKPPQIHKKEMQEHVQPVYKNQEQSFLKFSDFYEFQDPDDQNLPNIQEFINWFHGCQSSKQNFQDPDFPPQPVSLFQRNFNSRGAQVWQYIVWLRPIQFFGKNFKIFQKSEQMVNSRIGLGKYISPYDIQQGNLGDCYFLSSLSSMAQNPQRILKLFITPIVNENGIYCVKICHNGEWKAVFVDDYFPCFNAHSGPAFTKSRQKELWVLILEKAWAKLFRCYERIESGHCRDALRDLTGAPTKTIFTYKDYDQGILNDDLLIELQYAFSFEDQDFICTAGTSNQLQAYEDKLGLVSSHAYSVIGIFNNIINPQSGQEITLIKLRNPWGKKEWKGDWCENSPLWTNELKEIILNNHQQDGGIFFMDLTDFQRLFSDVSICYYYDSYKYRNIHLNSKKKHAKYVRFQVTTSGIYYITVNQKNKRNFEKSNYDYSLVRMLLAKLMPDGNFKFISAKQTKDKEVWIGTNLNEGIYYLYLKTEWINHQEFDYVLSSYGPEKVEFEIIHKYICPQMIESALKNQATSCGKLKPYIDLYQPHIQRCNKIDIKEGFGYIYLTNQSNVGLITKFVTSNVHGLKLRKPFKGNQLKFTVLPQTDCIAVFTVDMHGYQFQSTEQYQILKY